MFVLPLLKAKSIRTKTLQDLIALRDAGLGIVYMGLESGDNETLKHVRKGVHVDTMVEMGRRVRESGLKLSVTVLLGLAGPQRSAVHARASGLALSAMDPNYVGALSLMILPNTPLGQDYAKGHPNKRFTREEFFQKFRTILIPIMGKKQIENVINFIDNLEACQNIRELFPLLRIEDV